MLTGTGFEWFAFVYQRWRSDSSWHKAYTSDNYGDLRLLNVRAGAAIKRLAPLPPCLTRVDGVILCRIFVATAL